MNRRPTRYLPIVFVLNLLFLPRPPAFAEELESAIAVRTCFDDYKAAILSGNGKEAVRHISEKTLDYYAEIQTLALHGEASKVRALELMDRLMIISLRTRIPIQQLKSMSPRDLFVYAVENGWVGKESIQRLGLGTVLVKDLSAKGTYLYDGKEVELYFHFFQGIH